MKTQITDITTLYTMLRKGDVKLIADKVGVSTKTVWLVGHKRIKNKTIEEAIIIIAEKRERERKAIIEEVRKAII